MCQCQCHCVNLYSALQHQQTFLIRSVYFSRRLKAASVKFKLRTWFGRLFRADEPAIAKTRRACVLSWCHGTCKRFRSEEQRHLWQESLRDSRSLAAIATVFLSSQFMARLLPCRSTSWQEIVHYHFGLLVGINSLLKEQLKCDC